eukprot:TRINITY_DN816_c0_g1_i6.p1 TRINITY_DN816_c0_g1~~TRINITY_DN816_c0_g1_i6.p1  ORF type:complete len:461 (+),score=50.16 TRINITY_DN816_c0_g1_i6:30-1412(+)
MVLLVQMRRYVVIYVRGFFVCVHYSYLVSVSFFFFFNDTATTEIYTLHIVGSVRCVQETGINAEYMGKINKLKVERQRKLNQQYIIIIIKKKKIHSIQIYRIQMKLFFIFILYFLTVAYSSAQKVQCLNEDGKPVDWWVIMKLPIAFNTGLDYMYFDASSNSLEPKTKITGLDSSLFRTLAQIADQTTGKTASVFWNDQPPHEPLPPFTFAHQKGFLGFDLNGDGFILVHSAPNFVTVIDKKVQLTYPSTSLRYGQHFMCITIDSFDVYDKYAELLLIDRPYVYNSSIPSSVQKLVPNLVTLLDINQRGSAQSGVQTFQSAGGLYFTKFAKSGEYQVSFYATFVAPFFHTDMAFETWGNSAEGYMPPECDTFKVVSNLQVEFTKDDSFTSLDDHSKYGISLDGTQPIVCYGDINRQESQLSRGGGTVCFFYPPLHQILLKAFVQLQTCGKQNNSFLEEIQ